MFNNDTNGFASNYKGSYFAKHDVIDDTCWPAITPDTDEELVARGTHAIASVIPTNPVASLLQTYLEVRSEGMAHIPGNSIYHRAARARDAGSEYLNVEFGWKPLVNDLRQLAGSYLNSRELRLKVEKESGKLLKRSYRWKTEFSIEDESASGVYPKPSINVLYWDHPGTLRTVTTTKLERWFEGVFTYHLAPQGSLAREVQIAHMLYGARLTPETLWNLTPWSWLADWVSNMGDVIHNISAFANDGLVMPWAFIMSRKTVMKEYHLTGWGMKRYPSSPDYCFQSFTTTSKQRKIASPYGFGLSHEAFSPRQWAILGALGLSKNPGHLYND